MTSLGVKLAESPDRLKVAVTGASGLVGRALVSFLVKHGHAVVRLGRKDHAGINADGTLSVRWNPEAGELNGAELEGVDAVVNLAGEGIADKRWTKERKEAIRKSRVLSTELLARTIAGLNQKPRVFFCASAIGYYPSGSDQLLTEQHGAGIGFLPEVCKAWEGATKASETVGVRVVHGRFGMVLSAQGGALKAQLPLFRWGLGGRLGSGKQYISWIEISDLVKGIYFCLQNELPGGAVNLVAPGCVTNLEFTKTLARVLKRPAVLPAPAWALRLALGEMADALLLSSLRVIPQRLQQAGFLFGYPELESALRRQLSL